MKPRTRHYHLGCLAILGLGLLSSTACQTPQAVARESGQAKLLEALRKPANEGRIEHLRAAERLFAKAEDKKQQAMALQWIALVQRKAENYVPAIESLRRSLRVFEGHPGFLSRTETWWAIGDLELRLSHHDRAQAAFEKSWRLARAKEDLVAEGRAVAGLARILDARGEEDTARARFRDAHQFVERSGSMSAIANSLLDWGKFEAARGHTDAARGYYAKALGEQEEALRRWEADPDRSGFASEWEEGRQGAARILLAAAELELEATDLTQALAHLDSCQAMLQPLPMTSPTPEDTETNRSLRQRLDGMRQQIKATSFPSEEDNPTVADSDSAASGGGIELP